jgi:hypothetical protein
LTVVYSCRLYLKGLGEMSRTYPIGNIWVEEDHLINFASQFLSGLDPAALARIRLGSGGCETLLWRETWPGPTAVTGCFMRCNRQ